ERKLPSVTVRSRWNEYMLHFDAEQSPNRESRLTLSRERDRYGMNRLVVDWRYRVDDVERAVQTLKLIAAELLRSKVGKPLVNLDNVAGEIAQAMGVGSHHLGSTRMAASRQDGVVDANCRVHGVQNLYIASSSVFPTTGVANPTLTVTALALRIADELKRRRR